MNKLSMMITFHGTKAGKKFCYFSYLKLFIYLFKYMLEIFILFFVFYQITIIIIKTNI